jgi:hypothetical protein
MNFTTQQRDHILSGPSTNTAQERLIDILNVLNVTTSEIIVDDSLDGNLDFSVLSEKGFNKIENITLLYGNITNILNLPKGLKKLVCSSNLLIDLESLPIQLEELFIDNNHLTDIDVSYLKNLKILNISSNSITDLGILPKTLEELYCESNKLQKLNLMDVPDLKVLSISNNLITVIEDLPDNLTTFNMEDTPSIEFRNTHIDNINITTNKNEKEEKLDYNESLNMYFKFKDDYEKTRTDKLRAIYNNNKSKKTRKLLLQSFRMPCIYCKRAVNTRFMYKDDKYIAICGDNNSPCDLAITIYNGQFTQLNDLIDDQKEELLDIKNIIIEQKMDNLFNYIDEETSNQLFNKQLTAFNLSSNLYDKMNNDYNNYFNNKETMTKVSDLKQQVFKQKESINDLINNFQETHNKQLLIDAMAIYVNELLPKIKKINLLTHQIYIKEKKYNLDKTNDNEMSLFTFPTLLTNIEHNLAEEPEVIKFKID